MARAGQGLTAVQGKLPPGPQPGTTEHATALLVLLELGILFLIRRYFKSAHGG